MKKNSKLPLGIALLAILTLLAGLASIVLAAGAALVLGVLGGFMGSVGPLVTLFGSGVIGFLALLGVLSIAAAWGLWHGKSWAWWLTLIVAALGIVTNIVSGNISSLIIDLGIVLYLLRSSVQEYFNVEVGWSW